jgi:hypothetical protein
MTGYSRPDENTLGVVLGKRQRGGIPAASTAARAMRQASAGGTSFGTGYLGIGTGIVAVAEAVYGIAIFLSRVGSYPHVLPAAAAWFLFVLSLAAVGITIATRGERMSDALFISFVVAMAGVVALDFVAIWPLHDIGNSATASASVGFGLLFAVTLRRGREIVIVAVLLGVAFIVAILLTTPLTADTVPTQITVVGFAVLPTLFGVYVVGQFRRMVQLELDRVLVQSTVSAPRFAVGMLASDELARLDLAAEELLDSVATGRTPLPLSPKTASTAASLATELRLHLIEGRRETWLYHAITESEQLGRWATLTDPGSLAGLLDPQQRDGLLSAVWLLVSDRSNSSATAQVTLGPVAPRTPDAPARTIMVPVVITTTGVPRSRVDPATWNAIGKVGRFLDSTHNSSLRVEIECVVTNPADQ